MNSCTGRPPGGPDRRYPGPRPASVSVSVGTRSSALSTKSNHADVHVRRGRLIRGNSLERIRGYKGYGGRCQTAEDYLGFVEKVCPGDIDNRSDRAGGGHDPGYGGCGIGWIEVLVRRALGARSGRIGYDDINSCPRGRTTRRVRNYLGSPEVLDGFPVPLGRAILEIDVQARIGKAQTVDRDQGSWTSIIGKDAGDGRASRRWKDPLLLAGGRVGRRK